jgi:Mg-chelatase subunit ChlD
LAALPSFRAVVRRHRAAAAAAAAFALVAGVGVALVAARPARAETIAPETRSRDVVLCLDVSGSMYGVDGAVVKQFREIVGRFDGERVAMSWFNSSSVTLFPLTDDYEFIEDTLAPLERQFDSVNGNPDGGIWDTPDEDYPDQSGTLLGEGSSLPGDGLASCLQLFDHQDAERPRSVILATDNLVEGVPIFALSEAGAWAADAGVRVYALCPEDPSGYGLFDDIWNDYQAAFDELKREAESTGGGYYTAGDSASVRRIVDGILEQEAALTESAPTRLVYDRPFWGVLIAVFGLAGVGAFGGWRLRRRWPLIARRGALAVLAGLMVWNPSLGAAKYTQTATDADIMVLIDTSPSVAAEDWGDGRPRLDGVRGDLAAIALHHAGAHVSVIEFDSEARVTLPLTTDAGAVSSLAETLEPVSSYWATGSSVDSALETLVARLEDSQAAHPDRARLVYYLGDGEQTSQQAVRSFADAAPLLDGGAVLGYGTTQGGRMKEYVPDIPDNEYWPPELEERYIQAPGGGDAVSRVDEANLRQIASDLGVGYTLRSADAPVAGALWEGRLPERTLDREAGADRPLAVFFALAASPLLAWEIALLLGRFQRAVAATRLAGVAGAGGGGGIGGRVVGAAGTAGAAGGAGSPLPPEALPRPSGTVPPWGTGAWR